MKNNYLLMSLCRSPAWAIVLALCFGPIGLLYGSFWIGILMSIIVFIFFLASKIKIAVLSLMWFSWFLCPFFSVFGVNKYNQQLLKQIKNVDQENSQS